MRFTVLFFNTLTRCRFLRQLARISDMRHVYKYIQREFPMFRDIKDTRISLGLSLRVYLAQNCMQTVYYIDLSNSRLV